MDESGKDLEEHYEERFSGEVFDDFPNIRELLLNY